MEVGVLCLDWAPTDKVRNRQIVAALIDVCVPDAGEGGVRHEQAKEGKIKAYLARNDKMQAKIKFCTKGKPTYIGEPFASAFYDCAEYIAGGFKKLYHAGCGYHA